MGRSSRPCRPREGRSATSKASTSRDLIESHPAFCLCRSLHRLADGLHLQTVLQIGRPGTIGPADQQVAHLVDEAGAPTDALAYRPPPAGERMAGVFGANAPQPIQAWIISSRAVPQFVQSGVVEEQRPVGAVDLDGHVARATYAAAGHLE